MGMKAFAEHTTPDRGLRSFCRTGAARMLLLCFLFQAVIQLSAFGPTQVTFTIWHLPPREALMGRPLETLFFLHAQPPGFSALTWLLLAGSEWLSLPPSLPATLATQALALVTIVATYGLFRMMDFPRPIALCAPAFLVAHPYWYHVQSHWGYTQLLAALVPATAIPGLLVLRGRDALLPAVGGCLLAMTMLRPFWHPVLCAAWFGLLLALYRRRFGALPARRPLLLAAAILLVPPGCVMMKNHQLFDVPAMTSWLGLNLKGKHTQRFVREGTWNEAIVRAYYEGFRVDTGRFDDVPALTIVHKDEPLEEGGPAHHINLNHHALPALSAADVARFKADHLANPLLLADRAFRHLRFLDLPAYYNPYRLDAVGRHPPVGHSPRARTYNATHHFLTMWPLPRQWFQWRAGEHAWTPSLFLLVLVPLATAAPLVVRFAGRHSGPWDALQLTWVAFAWWAFLAVTLLVDGTESARMRWEVEGLFLLLVACAVRALLRWRRGRPILPLDRPGGPP